MVEVTNHCKTLLLVMTRTSKTATLSNFAQLRSNLIKEMLELLDSYCPSVKFTTSILHPEQLKDYPKDTKSLSMYFMLGTHLGHYLNGNQCVCDEDGLESLDFDDIVLKRALPLSCGAPHIKQLFNDSNREKTIPRALLRHIRSQCSHVQLIEEMTYEEVRNVLDGVSIFTRRNPFVS